MSEAEKTNDKPDAQSAPDKGEQKPSPSVPERATLGAAILLIATLAGFLGWHGLREIRPETAGARPQVQVQVNTRGAVSQPQGWAVPIEVKNTGNVPLREVVVKIDVRETDGKPGERELTWGFLAEGATETGHVTTFVAPDADPPTATLQSFQTKADARGY